MTEMLFRKDAYLRRADARVKAVSQQGGVVLDRSLFYPAGGGQPGDTGVLEWSGGQCAVVDTVKGDGDDIICIVEEEAQVPKPDVDVSMVLDWDRRHAHMRMHTALHLLSVAVPFGVTGGAITAEKGRLDFNMPDPLENKDEVSALINSWIISDAMVSEEWITQQDLQARPDLVKTLSVQPPRGADRVRLVRIGDGLSTIDLQPCGGTHVQSLSEIGAVRLGKVEKKGRMNRRVSLHLEG